MSVRSGKNSKLTSFISPMLATSSTEAFNDLDWLFETKWDGYRAIGEVHKKVRLYSRNGLSFEELYPPVFSALSDLPTGTIVDGEIVVLNEKNQSDFQRLQQFSFFPGAIIQFKIFDCLMVNNKSILNSPLIERKAILERLIPKDHPVLEISTYSVGSGVEYFDKMKSFGLEGMIAKNVNSVYVPGTRTRAWLKIKSYNTQEAIIVGFTAPRGSRKYFGSLLLAIMEDNKLRYIGHTGTGFTTQVLHHVYEKMIPLASKTPTLSKKPRVNAPVTWVRPKLVCNVKFTEVTQDGKLRHPVFQGLRIDKTIKEVNRIDVPTQEVVSRPGAKRLSIKRSSSAIKKRK